MSKYDRPERLKFCLEQREVYDPKAFYLSNHPDWVHLGSNVMLHEGVLFTDGFGYARDEDGNWLWIPHSGGCIIDDDVDIFPMTTINRGTIKNTFIGKGTKIDHHCHIGHNSSIGENCIICAGVIICGGVSIGDNVWIGPGSKILNKKTVGNDCYIAMGSNVVNDIPEHCMVKGNPAKSEYRDELPHNKIG